LLLTAYGLLVAAPIVLGNRVIEPFSELGILGPNMKLGDYPSNVMSGDEFDLFMYIGNYEGKTSYYRIYVKLGDSTLNVSDVEAYPGEILFEYDHVLIDETNHTEPLALSLMEPGVNQRLVLELHRYQNDGFRYDGIWTQLWINVTSPG
jgi:uncharacterized membrane protein